MQTHPLPGLAVPFARTEPLSRALDAIRKGGGHTIAVGGCVRDHLLGLPSKDIDLEVYHLAPADLERALAEVGDVHAVGRSFGVLKVRVQGLASNGEAYDETLDVALPRRESKEGRGHRGFVTTPDPSMPFAEAAARRDFTINALAWDLEEDRLLDAHGGVEDLRRGALRHVSPAFDEDPLRVLRACQLAARFGLSLDDDTLARCRNLEDELSTLPSERLWEEWKKLLLKAPWPSLGLWTLVHTGAMSLFPELSAMIGCPQEPEWHPEGDVWLHTLMVTDEAARLVRDAGLDDDERMIVTLGALCHDLGKPATTAFSDGRVRSINHESEGEEPTRSFLARIGAPGDITEAIVPLVREHLKPFQLYAAREHVSDGALRRLALRVNIPRVVLVARADHLGRTTPEALAHDEPAGDWLLAQAERLSVQAAAPRPLLHGRHLIERGIQPGPHMGPMLTRCFDAQLDGAFGSVEEGLTWLDENWENVRGEKT